MKKNSNEIFFKRLIEKDIEEALNNTGGIIVEGARFVGKTTICSKYAHKIFNLNDENDYQFLLFNNSDLFLRFPKPILIDELQIMPRLFSSAKSFIDQSRENGVVIFTGSVWINKRDFLDPAAGHFRVIRLNPLTLYESLDSEKKISLFDLIENNSFVSCEIEQPFSIEDLIFLTCRGGFPKSVLNPNYALKINHDYIDDILLFCLQTSRTKLNKRTFLNLFSYCARIDCQIPNWSEVKRNFPEICGKTISRVTLDKYLGLMNQLFLVDFVPSLSLNLSSIRVVMSKPKIYFCDPSIVVALLSLNKEKLLNNLKYFGFLFENLVYRDLHSYADFYGSSAKLGYFSDSNKFGIDFILKMPSGKFAAIEVEIGSNEEIIMKSAKKLVKYKKLCALAKNQVADKNKFYEWLPSKLIIITGLGKYAYKKIFEGEEIYVIPIQALMP